MQKKINSKKEHTRFSFNKGYLYTCIVVAKLYISPIGGRSSLKCEVLIGMAGAFMWKFFSYKARNYNSD